MLIEEITFFSSFLSAGVLRKYIQLSLKEDTGYLEADLYSNFYVIESWLDESFKLNCLDLRLSIQNYINYFIKAILNLERESWLEEQMKWYRVRTLEERECLKILKDVCLYQKKNMDDLDNHIISSLFLFECSLEELRKRKVMIWNEKVTKYDSLIKGFSVDNLSCFDKIETEKCLKKVLEYSKALKRE